MLLINVAASGLLSLAAPRPAVAAQPGPATPVRGGPDARDSAAVVRAARAALLRHLREIGAPPPPRYRVVALTRDSLGTTVAFTSCRVRPCIDGGARVLVRPDGRAEVLAIR